MSQVNSSKKIYFEHLDVIRFIAAFMVVFFHGYEAWVGWFGPVESLSGEEPGTLSATGRYIDQFIRNMGIGVDIFFLISGFLITYILLEEKKQFGKISIKNFIIRRTFRIWPLYYFIIAFTPFLVKWVDMPSPDYVPQLLFYGNFHTIKTTEWSYPFAHFWSICVEEHFYLIWPFIIAFVPRKQLLNVFAAIIFISILYRVYIFNTMNYYWFTLYLNTLSRLDVLVIGAVGAYYYSEKPFTFALSRPVKWFFFIVLIISLSIEPFLNWDSAFLASFKKYIYTGLIAVLLLDFNFNPNFKHWFPKKSMIHYFGKVSYGIYMYGNLLLVVVIKRIMWRIESTNMWVFFFFLTLLSILIPIISYELFEKHVLKLNKRFRRVKTDR